MVIVDGSLEILFALGAAFGVTLMTVKFQWDNWKVSQSLRIEKENVKSRKAHMTETGPGYSDTENNFAYFDTPVERAKQNNITFYEAEALDHRHEIQDELQKAKKEGNNVRIVDILANFYRHRDRALKNVARDYDKQSDLIQIRRQEGVSSNKRILETIADHPKFEHASRQVPHFRSMPIPVSMGPSYWRPTEYTAPGYLHV